MEKNGLLCFRLSVIEIPIISTAAAPAYEKKDTELYGKFRVCPILFYKDKSLKPVLFCV